MEGESGVTRSIIHDVRSLNIQGDQMAGESGVTGSIIVNFFLGISKEIKWKVKMVLLEASLMDCVVPISKDIKLKVKVVLLEVSLMNLIFGI